MMTRLIPYLVIFLFIVVACKKDKTPTQPLPETQWVVDTTLIHEMVAQVDSERIWQNMINLTSYPNRWDYGEYFEDAEEWLYSYLAELGCQVEYDPFLAETFSDIVSVNENNIWLTSEYLFGHSADGGNTWKKLKKLPINYSIQFIDEQNGFFTDATYGANAFMATTDAGETWNKRADITGVFMQFLNKEIGYLTDFDDKLYKTEDGGYTWNIIGEFNSSSSSVGNFFVLDSLHIWKGQYLSIKYTDDGGMTWSELPLPANILSTKQIIFFDLATGLLRSYENKLYRTTDGGVSWTEITEFGERQYINLSYLPSGDVWTSSIKTVYHSSDKGITWQKTSNVPAFTRYIHFVNENIGYISTDGGLLKTVDGGHVWIDMLDNLSPNLTLENIIVTIPGKIQPEEQILLTAFYDTNWYGPGADFNATGTASILECVSILQNYNFSRTLKMVLFAGSMTYKYNSGSRHFTTNAYRNGDNIIGGFNIETIGYWEEGLPRDLNVESNTESEWLYDIVSLAAETYTQMEVEPAEWHRVRNGDEKRFWEYGFDFVLLTEAKNDNELNLYIGTYDDQLYRINKQFLNDNIKVCVASVALLTNPVIISEGGN